MKISSLAEPIISPPALCAMATVAFALPLGLAIAITAEPLIVAALAIGAAGAAAMAMAGSTAARRSVLLSALAVSFVLTGQRLDTSVIVLEPWLVLFPICLVIWAGDLVLTRRMAPLDRIGFLALLVVIAAWLSFFGAIDVATWLKRALKVTWLFGLYLILVNWASNERQVGTLIRASLWGCAVAATATIAQMTSRWASEGYGEVFGAAGTFANSNEAATFLATFIVMGLAFYASSRCAAIMRPRSLLFLLGVCALGILFSRSRNGLISSLAVSSLLFARTPRVRRLLFAAVAVLMILAVTPSTAVLLNRLLGSLGLSGNAEFDEFMRGGDVGRLYLLQLYWTVIKANPVFGVGAANYGFIGDLRLAFPEPPPGIGILSPDEYLGFSSHNGFINWWLEAGTPGFLAFAASLVCAMAMVWRARRPPQSDPFWRALATGTLGALVVFVLTNLSGEFGVSEVRYWVLLALASISVRQLKAGHARSTAHTARRF